MGDRYQPGYGRPQDRYDHYDPRDNRAPRYEDRRAYDDRRGAYQGYDTRGRSRSPHQYGRAPSPPRSDRYLPPRDYGTMQPPRDYGREQHGGGYSNRPSHDFTFRGTADQDMHRPSRAEESFSFRAPGPQAPRFPPQQQPPPQQRGRAQDDQGAQGNQGRSQQPMKKRNLNRKPLGGNGWRKAPHERDLFTKQQRGGTPEQLEGMNAGQTRFAEVISSDESEAEDVTAPSKRRKTGSQHSAQEDAAPKWSNPEYFTALPPPETTNGPKKDIVQVIRKAKIDAKAQQATRNAVKSNDDFISFNMDEDSPVIELDDSSAASDVESEYAPKVTYQTPQLREGKGGKAVPDTKSHQNDSITAAPQPLSARITKAEDNVGLPPRPPPGLVMPTDDELVASYGGGRQGKKRKHEDMSTGVGSVLHEWKASGPASTPWFKPESRSANTDDTAWRLHEEICEFWEFVRPYEFEETARRDLIDRVQTAVRRAPKIGLVAKNVQIKCFGSFASGLYLPTSDMDLVGVSPDYLARGFKVFGQSASHLHKLGFHLMNTGVAAQDTVNPITRARVPIVKFVDNTTGIKVDISFENDSGLKAVKTFNDWKQQYPAMPVIVVLIKQLLAMRNLHEVANGGLGGFSIICLVVSFLQHHCGVQEGSMVQEQHFGELFMAFLDLYGNKFEFNRLGINLLEPYHYVDKAQYRAFSSKPSRLTIIDPNNPSNDISGGSSNIHSVLNVFRLAHAAIQRHLAQLSAGHRVNESILGCILGGNYTSFIRQREWLRNLSDTDSGDLMDLPLAPVQTHPAQINPAPTKKRTLPKELQDDPQITNRKGRAARRAAQQHSLPNKPNTGYAGKANGAPQQGVSKRSKKKKQKTTPKSLQPQSSPEAKLAKARKRKKDRKKAARAGAQQAGG